MARCGMRRCSRTTATAARGRGGAGVPFGAVVAAAGQDAALGRALLGRRHADRRLGLDEELPAEGRLGLAAGAGAQRRARLPQGEALEREPRLEIPTRGSTARPTAARAGCASWGTS